MQELASAEGNILENTSLLGSLNETKAKSTTISESLAESMKLQKSLNQVISSFFLSHFRFLSLKLI